MDECPFDTRLARTPYLVVPKLALQAMPLAWRERLEGLLAEADAAGMETPNYHVFRNDPAFTHAERADSEDDYSQVLDLFLVRPDPWADYRRGDIRALCPTFQPPPRARLKVLRVASWLRFEFVVTGPGKPPMGERSPRSKVLRRGDWLFAFHPANFRLIPNFGLYSRSWWSIWWLWFEVGFAWAGDQ